MRKSKKLLDKADIPKDLSDNDRMTIENNILLKHIIDNDLKHMWAWIKGIFLTLVGLIAKSFLGG